MIYARKHIGEIGDPMYEYSTTLWHTVICCRGIISAIYNYNIVLSAWYIKRQYNTLDYPYTYPSILAIKLYGICLVYIVCYILPSQNKGNPLVKCTSRRIITSFAVWTSRNISYQLSHFANNNWRLLYFSILIFFK